MIYKKPKNEIFASDAKDGEIVEFPNVKRGWGVTENLGFIPPMEYFNAAFNRVDKSLAYQLQRGVGEWDKDLEYPIGAIVSLSGVIYIAKSQNTNKNPANEATIWDIVATQKWSENQLMEREFQCSKAQNGYTKLPNGLILQWGTTTAMNVIFPIAFNKRLNVSLTSAENECEFAVAVVGEAIVENPSNTGFNIGVRRITGSAPDWFRFYWFAIGY